MPKIRSAVLIVIVIIIIAIIIVLENPFRERVEIKADEGTNIGNKIPDISFIDLEGKEVKLSDFRGENLIINSWAAWCPFCINEMPRLQKASDENDITILFIHRTKTEPEQTARSYIQDFQNRGTPITDPVLLDPEDNFYTTFFGFGMPVSLFVDKSGIIKDKKNGDMTEEEIIQRIERNFGESEKEPEAEILEPSKQERLSYRIENNIVTFEDSVKVNRNLMVVACFGGKDCIPSIDNPKFISAEEAGWLPDEEFGLGIVHKGEARFYPFRILVSHEIVNDFIQGDPILISYCPLCFTGVAFERRIDGEAVEFGVSGKLYNSELVMYDRKTDSYWPQSLARAVQGPLIGTELKKLITDTVKWGNWRKVHPNTKVLSKDTGFGRNYDGSNPYGEEGNFLSIQVGESFDDTLERPVDTRVPRYEVVYGIEINGKFKAYKKSDLENLGVIEDTLGGENITIEFDQELESARAFTESGDQILVETLFWFAWAAFHPETEVFKT